MKHNKLSLSIVTRLFSGSSVSRKGGARSRCKTLRLEPLEDRRLLDAASGGDEPELPEPPITVDEYSAIQTRYSNFLVLPDEREGINILEVDLSEGASSAANLSALKAAIAAANETQMDDLIVVRTGPTKGNDTSDNTITFSSAADELSISLSEDFGSLAIVSWGTDSSGALIPLTLNANSKSRVASISGSGPSASLGGFVFLNGDSAKSVSNKNSGGGLYVDASAIVYLENSTINNCKASEQGGGIDNNGTLFLYNSTFSGNSANKGGGVNFGSSTSMATIQDCFFNANESNFGAGLYNDADNLSVEKSSFLDNTAKNDGGAIFNAANNLTIKSASICNNQAANGAGFYNEGTAEISNSLIADNIATAYGGGIYLGGLAGNASLYSSTIASNQAAKGGGIYSTNDSNSCMAVNSIIALNTVTISGNYSTADLYGSYVSGNNCLIGQGSLPWPDTVVYKSGPLFSDAANGDYTLAKDSLAIDEGMYDFAMTTFDLAEKPRIVGTNIDLGAYEYQTEVTPKLASPDSLTAVATSAYFVTMSWTIVPDASYYVLERSVDSENWTTAAQSLTTNVFVDSSLTSGTQYYYRVQAVNAQISSPFSAPAIAYTKPDRVTEFAVSETSTTSVKLSWTTVPRASGYQVERSLNGYDWVQLSSDYSGTTYDDSNLESPKTYYYRVAANNPGGTGEYSEIVSIKTGLKLRATASPDSIVLSWDSIANADGYIVEKYNGSTWTPLATLTGQNSTTYTDTGLTAATEYQYRVKATSGANSSEYETFSWYTTTEKPKNLSATVLNSSQTVLTWDNVSGADSYTVRYKQIQEGGQVVEYPTISCTSNVITLSDLTASSNWEASIEAVNQGGGVKTDPVSWHTGDLQNSGLTDAQVLAKQRAQSQNRGILFVNTLEDSVTLNPNDGWITLREAIAYAGTEGWGTTIQFNVSGTITLARQALTISKSLSILADGVVIDAYSQSSGLSLEGTNTKPITVTLAGITVKNGLSTGAGGGIACRYSTLNVANSAVLNNKAATFGGGLYADHSTIILVDSTVSDNQTTGTDSQGGGAYGDAYSKIFVSLSALVETDLVSASGSSGIVICDPVIGETIGTIGIADDDSTVSITSQRQNVYTVELNSKPTSNVVVVLDVPDGLTTSVRALTFTPSNWSVPQTVHVGLALNSTLEQGSNQAIRHTTLSSDTNFLNASISDVQVSLESNDSQPLPAAAGVLVLPVNHKTNYNLAAQTALPAGATSLTDWDAFYQEIWVESVGLAAGATITKTLSYDPRLFDVASDACLIAADGVEGSFEKNSIDESKTEIMFTLTVNDPLGLSVQGSKLYLGSVLFTPNTTSSAGLSDSTTATVFGAAVSGVPYDLKRDGAVNMTDFIEFAKQFNKKTNQGETPSAADFNGDGTVNMTDFIEFAKNFNKKKTDSLSLIPGTGKSAPMAASLNSLAFGLTVFEEPEPVAVSAAIEKPVVEKPVANEPIVVAEPVLATVLEVNCSGSVAETDNSDPVFAFAAPVSQDDSFITKSIEKDNPTAREDLFNNQTPDSFTLSGAVRSADSDDSVWTPQAIDEAMADDSFWDDEDRYQIGESL